MELVMKKWVEPSIDTSKWEFYDLSCKASDDASRLEEVITMPIIGTSFRSANS